MTTYITIFNGKINSWSNWTALKLNHTCLPAKRVFAFGSKKVDMIFELQLENKIFLNGVLFIGFGDVIAEQWQTGQWWVILEWLVEEQTEVGEHNPKFLPAIAVFEFAQQKPAQLILVLENKKEKEDDIKKITKLQFTTMHPKLRTTLILTSVARRWSAMPMLVFLCQQTCTVVLFLCAAPGAFPPLISDITPLQSPLLLIISSEEPEQNTMLLW